MGQQSSANAMNELFRTKRNDTNRRFTTALTVSIIIISSFGSMVALVPMAGAVEYFSDAFDPMPKPGWSMNGAWHSATEVLDSCYGNKTANHPPSAASFPTSLAYHYDTSPPAMAGYECTYNLDMGGFPSMTYGWVSRVLDLSGISGPIWLHFSTWRETEAYPINDLMTVAVTAFGNPVIIAQVFNPTSPQTSWSTVDGDLSPWAGSLVQIFFSFYSVTSSSNEYAGWYIDDLVVDNVPPTSWDTVTFKPESHAPISVAPGTQNVAMAALDFTTSPDGTVLQNITVDLTGTPPTDSDVSQVRTWIDNGDGMFRPGTELPLGSGMFASHSVTLPVGFPLIPSTTTRIWLSYDINSTATPGNYVGAAIRNATYIRITSPDVAVCDGCPLDTYVPIGKTLISSGPVINTLNLVPTSTAPTAVSIGDGNVLMGNISISVDANSADVTSVKLGLTGASVADADVASVELLRDDGDGVLDADDSYLGAGVFSSLTSTIPLIPPMTVLAGSPETIWVEYDISAVATVGHYVGFGIADATFVTVSSPDVTSCTGCPFDSYVPGTRTIVQGLTTDTLTFTPTDMAPDFAQPGAMQVLIASVDLSAGSNQATATSLRLDLMGVPPSDLDITSASLLKDDGDGVLNAPDVPVGTGTFSGNTVRIPLTPPLVVSAGSPERLWVTFDISAMAVLEDFVGIEIADAAYLSVATPDSGACSGCPMNTHASGVKTRITTIDMLTAAPSDAAPPSAYPGQTDVPMMDIDVSVGSNEVLMTSLVVGLTGTGIDSDVASVSVWLDDGDGLFEASADTGLDAESFSAGSATLSISRTVMAGAPRTMFVTYTIAPTASPGVYVGASLSGSGSFAVSLPDTATCIGCPLNTYDGSKTLLVQPPSQSPMARDLTANGFPESSAGILHIITPAPAFAWSYMDPEGDPQTDYEARVGTAPGLADMWSPGPSGSAGLGTTYGGSALSDGTDYYLAVRVHDGTSWSSWNETLFHMNSVVQPTMPIYPTSGATVTPSASETVSWTSGGPDPEGDTSSYEWQVATDAAYAAIFASGSSSGTTSDSFATTSGRTYYWRVRMCDGWECSGYLESTFSTTGVNAAPVAGFPGIEGYVAGTVGILHVLGGNSFLNWTYSDTDGDPQMQSEVRVGTAPGGSDMWLSGPLAGAATTVGYGGATLVDGEDYYLGVRVSDGLSWSVWAEVAFHVNAPPIAPALTYPSDGDAHVPSGALTIRWSAASDREGDSVGYDWWVSTAVDFSTVVATSSTYQTSAGLTASDSTTYYWRVRARDAWETGANSSTSSFTTSTPAPPPTGGSMTVLVLSGSGLTVSGATVSLSVLNGPVTRTATTNANGMAVFTNVTFGDYVLIANAPGYFDSQPMSVTLSSENQTEYAELTVGSTSKSAEDYAWLLWLAVILVIILLLILIFLRAKRKKGTPANGATEGIGIPETAEAGTSSEPKGGEEKTGSTDSPTGGEERGTNTKTLQVSSETHNPRRHHAPAWHEDRTYRRISVMGAALFCVLILTLGVLAVPAHTASGSSRPEGEGYLVLLRDQRGHEASEVTRSEFRPYLEAIATRRASMVQTTMDIDNMDIMALNVEMDSAITAMRRAIVAQSERLHAATSDIVAALAESLAGEVTYRGRILNILGVRMSAEAADVVKKSALVAEVMRDEGAAFQLDVSVPTTGAQAFWNAGFTGGPFEVAVVDTGVDSTHPNLIGKISDAAVFHTSAQTDPTYTDNPTDPDDFYGHGTHIAGIVAGVNPPYRGVAYGLSGVINAKFGYTCNCMGGARGQWSDMMDAIDWAVVTAGADVVSLSFGGWFGDDGNSPISLFVDAIVDDLGVYFASAAGNMGGFMSVISPAVANNIFSVGAIEDAGTVSRTDDYVADFSSGGPTPDLRLKPDIVAPGVNISSAAHDWEGGGSGNDYVEASGTSMATPHVAAGLALFMHASGGMPFPARAKAVFLNSAEDLGLPDGDNRAGWGHMDLDSAWTHRNDVLEDNVTPSSPRFYRISGAQGDRVTLVWQKHVVYAGATGPTAWWPLNNLDLELYDESTGALLAKSILPRDNVEQLVFPRAANAIAKVFVNGALNGVAEEHYAIAFSSSPQPTSAQPALSVDLSAPAVVDSGTPFRVDAWVNNTGGIPVAASNVTLNLPPGVAIVSGVNPATLGTIPVGGSRTATWIATSSVIATHTLSAEAQGSAYGAKFGATSPLASVTVRDGTPPTIVSPSAVPSPQNLGDPVNISAGISDESGISGAWVEVWDPFSVLLGNFSLVTDSSTGRMFYRGTYSTLGTYSFRIYASDTVGNGAFKTGTFVMDDLLGPSITNVLASPDPQEIFSRVNVTATVTDNVGVAAAYIEVKDPLGGTTNTTMDLIGTTAWNESAYSLLGVHDFLISAQDTGGRWATATGNFTMRDSTLPVAVAGPDQNVDAGTVVTFDGSASNDNAGIVSHEWTFTDGVPVTLNGAITTHAFLNPGSYVVTLRVTDTSGNEGTDTLTVFVTDTTPPQIHDVRADPPVQNLGSVVSVSAIVTDGSGIAEVWINVTDPNAVQTNSSLSFSAGRYINSSAYLIKGLYTFDIWARDATGYWNKSSGSFQIADLTPPNIQTVAAMPDTQESGSPVTIAATVVENDALSSVTMEVLDSSMAVVATAAMTYVSGEWTAAFIPPRVGVYQVTVTAEDVSLLVSSRSTITRAVDLTDPVLAVTAPSTADVFVNAVFNVTVSDNSGLFTATIEFREPGGYLIANRTLTGTSPFSEVQAFDSLGAHAWTVWAVDPSGNTAVATGTFQVNDSVNPQANAGDDRTLGAGGTAWFDGTGSSDNMAIATYEWTFTEGGTARTIYGVRPTFTFTQTGTYMVQLRVVDLAGNEATDTVTMNVRDPGAAGDSTNVILALILFLVAAIITVFILLELRKRKGDKLIPHEDKREDEPVPGHRPADKGQEFDHRQAQRP